MTRMCTLAEAFAPSSGTKILNTSAGGRWLATALRLLVRNSIPS